MRAFRCDLSQRATDNRSAGQACAALPHRQLAVEQSRLHLGVCAEIAGVAGFAPLMSGGPVHEALRLYLRYWRRQNQAMQIRPSTDGASCVQSWPMRSKLPAAAESMANSEASNL